MGCSWTCRLFKARRAENLDLRQTETGWRASAQEIAHELARRPDLGAERHRLRSAKEQAALHVAAQRSRQVMVDAELPRLQQAVAQAAMRQAVPGEGASAPFFGARLEDRLLLQVSRQPRRAHGAGGKPRYAHEHHDVLGPGAGEDALEVGVRIALLGHREGRADLHGVGPGPHRRLDTLRRIDAARGNERDAVRVQPALVQRAPDLGQDTLEIEARVRYLVEPGRAEVAAG